eukprot:5231562-Pleurochrysis_carterae.AAC.1
MPRWPRILQRGEALHEALVIGVFHDVVLVSTAVGSMFVDVVALHSELRKEGRDAIRATERPGEQQEKAVRPGCGTEHVISGAYFVWQRYFVGIGESRWFGLKRWLWRNSGCADPDDGSRRPWKASFIKVDVGGHNHTEAGHDNVRRAGRPGVESVVDPDPGARVHAKFEHGWFGLDSERLATKRHDTHDGGLFACPVTSSKDV